MLLCNFYFILIVVTSFVTGLEDIRHCQSCISKEKCNTYGEMDKDAQDEWMERYYCDEPHDNPEEDHSQPPFGFSNVAKGDFICCPRKIWSVNDIQNNRSEIEFYDRKISLGSRSGDENDEDVNLHGSSNQFFQDPLANHYEDGDSNNYDDPGANNPDGSFQSDDTFQGAPSGVNNLDGAPPQCNDISGRNNFGGPNSGGNIGNQPSGRFGNNFGGPPPNGNNFGGTPSNNFGRQQRPLGGNNFNGNPTGNNFGGVPNGQNNFNGDPTGNNFGGLPNGQNNFNSDPTGNNFGGIPNGQNNFNGQGGFGGNNGGLQPGNNFRNRGSGLNRGNNFNGLPQGGNNFNQPGFNNNFPNNNNNFGNNRQFGGIISPGGNVAQCPAMSYPPDPQSGCCGIQAKRDLNEGNNPQSASPQNQIGGDPMNNLGQNPPMGGGNVVNTLSNVPSWFAHILGFPGRFSRSVPEEDNVNVTFNTRITGGKETELEDFPWTVLLKTTFDYGDRQAAFTCGGAIISSKYVITAGHCVSEEGGRLSDVEVHLAEYDKRTFPLDCINVPGEGRRCIQNVVMHSEEVIPHPEYDDMRLENDIALIRLNGVAPYTNYIRPICLPQFDVDNEDLFNLRFAVAGWGRNGRLESEVKQSTIVNLVPQRECLRHYPQLTRRHLCAAGYKGEDTCKGDSGGPLMVSYQGRFFVTGIVSGKRADSPCGTSVPSLYTNVFHYVDWIRRNMRD